MAKSSSSRKSIPQTQTEILESQFFEQRESLRLARQARDVGQTQPSLQPRLHSEPAQLSGPGPKTASGNESRFESRLPGGESPGSASRASGARRSARRSGHARSSKTQNRKPPIGLRNVAAAALIAFGGTLAIAVLLVLVVAVTSRAAHAQSLGAAGSAGVAGGASSPATSPSPYLNDALKDRTRSALDRAAQAQPKGVPDVGFTAPTGQSYSPVDPARIAQQFGARPKPKPGVLIFVSTSMPKESITRLAQDVRKVGGALVIRGLLDHSLRSTVTALAEYNRLGVQILIHPDAFKRHQVTAVPSFVVDLAPEEPICADGRACRMVSSVVEGDVSLDFALQRIESASTGALRTQTGQWLEALHANALQRSLQRSQGMRP